MSDASTSPPDMPEEEVPSNEELSEPSTEKEPAEEPKAPSRDEPEPSHEAVGIGVIGRPQVEPEESESGTE
jgi:hypothetical protein